MKIEVLEKSLLAVNEHAAEQNRRTLDDHGVLAINILGGDGCGKTALLEQLIPRLRSSLRVAVLEGDLATTRDAERIAALDVPVVQLLTEGGCHLTATLVHGGLDRLDLHALDLLFIENVGNPVCPANFDLGEHHRLTVLSVPEGDDKPAKYPHLFKVADLVVISKTDLLDVMDFNKDRVIADIRKIDPDKTIVETSTHQPACFDPLVYWIQERLPVRAQ